MKNIPSFKEFNENYSLLESAGETLESLYNTLLESYSEENLDTVNEGLFGNFLSNWASKTFLGPLGLSKVSYIDKARKVYLGLELELLKRKNDYENKLESYNEEMDKLSSKVESDKPKMQAIDKKMTEEKDAFVAYSKAQKLKIENAKDVIEAAIDGNERRRAYADAGMAEDKIVLADKEYEYAKNRSASSGELDELTERMKKLKSDLEEKVNKFKESEEEKSEKEKEITKDQKETVEDPIAKKIIEKVKNIKSKGIIDIVEEIKKDIATLEAEQERLKEEMIKKRRARKLNDSAKDDYKKKMRVIEAEVEGRKKQLEVLEDLGKNSISITKNLKNPKKSQEVLDKIAEIDMKSETEKSK
jgi:hypothetical protein